MDCRKEEVVKEKEEDGDYNGGKGGGKERYIVEVIERRLRETMEGKW